MAYPVPAEIGNRFLRAIEELSRAMVECSMTDARASIRFQDGEAVFMLVNGDGESGAWVRPIDDLRGYEEWSE